MRQLAPNAPKAIDHIVLPVLNLEQAQLRYQALGFSPAEPTVHPFGTTNACIFLQDSTYLEPLAVTDRLQLEAALKQGNPFLRRDQSYRFRVGEEGCSLLALSCESAENEHQRFAGNGFDYGKILEFFRLGKNNEKLNFKLAFAFDECSPDAAFFACERSCKTFVSQQNATHPNGVTGLSAVFMSEENPSDFQYLLQTVTGCRDFYASSSGVSFDLRGTQLCAYTSDDIEKLFLTKMQRQERGLRFEGIILQCFSLAQVQRILDKNAVDYLHHLSRIIIPPAPGQGVTILFEESSTK